MKITGLLVLAVITLNFSTFHATAQQKKTVSKTSVKVKSKNQAAPVKKPGVAATPKTDKPAQPLTVAEKNPQFPGGNEALEKYFLNSLAVFNLKY